jgi:hypothetical protein
MPSDFFATLGKSVAAELANPSGRYPADPATRTRLGQTLRTTLTSHLSRPMAQDQALPSAAVSGLDQEPAGGGGAPISGADCLQFVKICAAKLAGPEREEFLSGIAELLGTEEPARDGELEILHRPNGNGNGNGNGLPANNKGALDRRGRTAQDSAFAVRGMNTANFLKRFPMADIKFGGTGR